MSERISAITGKPKRRRKAKPEGAACFIGTRPLVVSMTLRGEPVTVEAKPLIGTTTHVNFKIVVRHEAKALRWQLTHTDLLQIARVLVRHIEQQVTH